MNDVLTEERPIRKSRTKKKKGNIVLKIIMILLSLAIWSGVVYYGFITAKEYIDTSIKNVQQQNAVNLTDINDQIIQLSGEISALRESIEDTDSSLSSTGDLQESIDEQLSALDKRLRELEDSLEILQEAP